MGLRFNISVILIFSLIISVYSIDAFSQREADNWYFGNFAGLNFASCDPVPLLDSKLSTDEGVATISDINGNLLFYTNGIKIWNKAHLVMQNGNGLTGTVSSTQSAIIIPQPGNDSIYFVFTIDDEGGSRGLSYSVVNINHNGGLGEVVLKNVQILNSANEKLIAVKHANNIDFWVITRTFFSDKYYTWLVTSAGVSSTPVISSTSIFLGSPLVISRGYLKASVDGKKLACAFYENPFIELANFNDQTGIVSNAFKISSHPSTIIGTGVTGSYGVEFSPNSKYLYICSRLDYDIPPCGTCNGYNIYINQYNTSNFDSASVSNSVVLIDSGGTAVNPNRNIHAALQLAKNGKIYIAQFYKPYLSVINNPDEYAPNCGFQINAVSLGGNRCVSGLPTFIQSYFNPNYRVYDFNYTENCTRTFNFNVTGTTLYDSIRWYFNGLSASPGNTSTLANPSHQYPLDGPYDIRLIVYNKYGCINKTDTIFKSIVIGNKYFELGSDKLICENDSILLDATATIPATYLWNTGQMTPAIYVSNANYYYCDVTANGCTYRDSIRITHKPVPSVNLGKDSTLCDGNSLFLDATFPNASYHWQDNSISPAYTVIQAGEYSINVNLNGCSRKDTIKVDYISKPYVQLGNDGQVCKGKPVILKPTIDSTWQIQWQDGTTVKSYIVSDTGTYKLTASNRCGAGTDEIKFTQGVCDIYIPTSFTPNNDGKNDAFKVLGAELLEDFRFSIFNRYGQRVFITTDKYAGWDGTLNGVKQENGTYIWILTYRKVNQQKIHQLKGSMILLK